MAVLKDLIVHGPSRFISAVGFTDLTANKVEADTVKAENGYFTKLKAKTATMDSVVVNELLDVHGELHTKSWSNSNIATVDGNFHIVPTITAATATGTITYSSGAYSMDVTGAFATNTLTVGNSTSVVAWTPGSSLIVSGEVQINNEWLPLGTLKCDLGGSSNLATDATSKKIPLSNIKDSNGQVSGVLEIIREALNLSGTSSTLNFRNVKIAFYSRKNTKMYPIGILLTAQGTGSSKTFIDMYNGNNESSSTYGGLAMPVVRIGNLSGNTSVANNQPLPAVGGQTPTGWGIYTSNGYFSGTIAAEKGKIANFTINGTKLYSNGHSAYNTSVTGIYIGDDYISFGSGGVTYFNTSGTGQIGPWTLTTNAIYNGKTSNNVLVSNPATNTSVAGVYLGTDGLNISNGTAATTAYITKTEVNIGNKLKWNGTTLSVNGTVTASSGTIGGWTLNGSSLYKYADSTGATVDSSKAKYYVYIQSAAGSNGGNYAFALRSRTDAQVTANSPAIGSADVQFGVSWNGSMYARNATVTGTINALTGTFGNATNKITVGTGTSGHSAIRYGMTTLADTTNTGFYIGTDGIALGKGTFKVTAAGALTATSGAIGSSVTIGGTAASTVLTNIANAATTATTYIADIDSNTGITIKALKGTTDTNTITGNYIKLNTSGLEIYQGGVSVAQYGTSSRIGKTSAGHVVTASDGIELWGDPKYGNDHTFIYSSGICIGVNSEQGVIGFGSGGYINGYYNEIRENVTEKRITIEVDTINGDDEPTSTQAYVGMWANGSEKSAGVTVDVNDNEDFDRYEVGTTIVTLIGDKVSIQCKSLEVEGNNTPISFETDDGTTIDGATMTDALVADASNNLILGRGWWAKNTSGYNTYIEGYETNLWGRNKIATNRAITQGSDKRLKKDIKNLENVKNFVMDLKPVEFKYEFASDKDKHLGFIAQDVEKSMNTYGLSSDKYGLITEITGTDNIQYKGLNYTEFIPICIKMIQEQQQEINTLKEALNEVLGN